MNRLHNVAAFRVSAMLVITALVVLLAACASEPASGPVDVIVVPTAGPAGDTAAASGTVLDALASNSDFALFLAGWNRLNLSQNLATGGPFTVFAPTNVAFSRMRTPTSTLDPDELEQLLRHHVVPRALSPDELGALSEVESSAGATLALRRPGDRQTIDYATVVGEPIQTGNGVVYPVDAVLLPPETGPEKSLWGRMLEDERLTAVVEAMGGTETMYFLRFSNDPDAFLAPTNEAMAAAPDGLLPPPETLDRTDPHYNDLFLYHVMMPGGWPDDRNMSVADMLALGEVQTPLQVPGSFGRLLAVTVEQRGDDVFVNGARLVETDIEASNAMLHLIDAVLVPPDFDAQP